MFVVPLLSEPQSAAFPLAVLWIRQVTLKDIHLGQNTSRRQDQVGVGLSTVLAKNPTEFRQAGLRVHGSKERVSQLYTQKINNSEENIKVFHFLAFKTETVDS